MKFIMPLQCIPPLLLFIFMAGGLAQAEDRPVVGDVPQKAATRFVQNPKDLRVETWIENLVVPWSLRFLPDGRALVSERPGRIRLIREGELVQEPYLRLDVAAVGEGGIMGLAVHPDFPAPPYLYAMFTYRDGGRLYNRLQRFRDRGDRAEPGPVILDRIPGARFHNGGRLAFGPDRMLYVTSGENFQASLAQDLNTPAGSILRIAPDGSIPADNPFPDSPIWSYGHRNPQGLAWHPQTGDLFASEHGPSGEFGLHGHDIVNLILKGKNYGWPLEIGAGGLDEYEDPLIMWKEATPPSGMTFWKGSLYVATLRSEALMRIELDQGNGSYRVLSIEGLFASERFRGAYGRLRDAVAGPDGALYVLTSNRDGRGSPREGDDRILRITAR
ncbi:MAG: PQQ-dependent sugar dehydrogenase [Desulfohalobiaceae bacterium]|nr:PQQ-dependent sugar dehydrogenase [Desulfohalobiaceae bacterium]